MGQRRWLRRHQRITQCRVYFFDDPEKRVVLKGSRKAKRADRRASVFTAEIQGRSGRERLARQGLERLYRKWEREGAPF